MEPPNLETRDARPWFRRLPAGWKFAVALGLILWTALLPRRPVPAYAFPGALVLGGWILCRMPLGRTWRRLLLAEMFLLGMAALTLLDPAAAPVFYSVLLKSHISVLALLLLTWTTPFEELLAVPRRLRFPAVLLSILALACRYLPVLAAEAGRMRRARASRAFHPGRGLAWRQLAEIIGRLFLRGVDRAERVYQAMSARGWK